MSGGRIRCCLSLAALVLGACRGAPPVLPPIPPGSGQVMVRAGDPIAVRDGQVVIDRVVAIVNGDAILMSELQEAAILYQRETKGPTREGREMEELQRTVLDRMINHRLQVQEAQREKVEVTDDDLRNVVDDFVKRNGGDRAQIEAQLQSQGLRWEGLRRELREQLLAQRIRGRRVSRRASVTEPEVDAYLTENRAKFESGLKYRVRHIVVPAEPPGSASAWERARLDVEALAAALQKGADFATLARERSREAAAGEAGDLGWLARGELEASFEEPILRLAKGEVTTPIRAGSGYHLFKLEDREELTEDSLREARQQARDLLIQKKAQERFDEWVEGLRRRALISVRL